MTSVLIADDQPETRRALRTIVAHTDGFAVCGEAVDGLDAVGQARRRNAEIVLMDLRMPRMDGIAATRELTAQRAGPAVIVLTTFDHDANVFGALQAGAVGFLLKTAPVADVQAALRAVAAGDGLIDPSVTRRLVARFAAVSPARAGDPSLETLTARERDVLQGIARGRTNAQIAADLVLEESTIKGHVGRLLAKLGCTSRAQAVVFAYEAGVVVAGQPRR